jgi:hypothetical protein
LICIKDFHIFVRIKSVNDNLIINHMKRVFILLTFIIGCIAVNAQVPQGFNYQAIARDGSGNLLSNKSLPVQISILSDTISNVYVWEEQQNATTNSSGTINLVIGATTATKIQGSAASFSAINWGATPLYIRIKIYYQNEWKTMGSAKLWSVPYSMVSEKANSVSSGSKLSIVSANDAATDALFEVKRKDGQTVFAVYSNAVNVYVPNSVAKGGKGGFAIGGFDAKAGTSQDFFRVTPDSIRAYIDNSPVAKGGKGGFAIGGYETGKGILSNYFMNVTGATAVSTVIGSPQILWYPNKNAFLAGNVHIGHVDSVGSYSTALGYQSIAMGNYSQAFGYKAKAFGDYSTSIGKNSVAGSRSAPIANNAFAFGNNAQAKGDDSYALGSGAVASGLRSFAFGSVGLDGSGNPTTTPTSATQPYTVAIGMGAQAIQKAALALGVNSIASGNTSMSIGNNSQASNTNSLALGNGVISSGINSTAIGYQSQANGELSIALGSFYSYSYSLLPYFTVAKGPDPAGESKGDFIIRPPSIIPIFRTITFSRANIANGKYSIAVGNGNLATNGGMALGSNNDATAFGAVAIGVSNQAVNTNTYAAGYNNFASGYYATAFGNNTYSKAYGSFVIGQYNEIAGDSTKWIDTDPLFVVGNGLNDADRSNALTIYKNGRTIFLGADANVSINDRVYRYMYNPFTHTFTSTNSVYGLKSYVNRVNTSVNYFYSGYFYNTGTAGTYNGVYADVRTGDGFDVAEYYYDTSANTEPGDVVIADVNNKESVVKSNKSYQTSVLGVISTKPHMTMGLDLVINQEKGEAIKGVNGTRLALNGRVPVKVIGENGPIVPGDLVTSSSTPGYAMKWTLLDVNAAKDFNDLKRILAENERRRNAIIGKAVESFSGSGSGKIMVLISLQ